MKKNSTITKTTMMVSAFMLLLSFLSAPAYAQPGSRGCNAHFNYRADSVNALMVNFHTNMAHNSSYAWDFGDGSVSSEENPVHRYAFPGPYTVLQTVTTQRGCRTIALDEKTGRVVTCAPKYGPMPAAVKGGWGTRVS